MSTYIVLVFDTTRQLGVDVRHRRAASMIERERLDLATGYGSTAQRGRMVSTPVAYGVERVCLSVLHRRADMARGAVCIDLVMFLFFLGFQWEGSILDGKYPASVVVVVCLSSDLLLPSVCLVVCAWLSHSSPRWISPDNRYEWREES